MPLARRTLVTGGAALAGAVVGGLGLVEARAIPGRGLIHGALGLTGPDGVVPDVRPGRILTRSFRSAARADNQVTWSVAYPPDTPPTARLPVALALHGRGGDHRFAFDVLGLDRFLAQAVADGAPPFALVSVDGGSTTFWHPRRNGDNPEAMLVEELLPRLTERGLLADRIGLIGWSMGGYGALLFAERHPDRVAAVAAASPALSESYDDALPDAFDDEADFQAHDVFADRLVFREIPLRIDCGKDDAFAPATEAFIDSLSTRPSGRLAPGDHTAGYWKRVAPAQLAFLARHLAVV